MASGIFSRLYRAFKTFDQAIDIIIGRGPPPGNLYTLESYASNEIPSITLPSQSLTNILNDAFLWAAPKKRRTIEKRLNRKFGHPKYIWKPHVPKTNIITCKKCGHDYEAGTLCGYCYEIVKKETEEMQNAIQASLGLSPVEQDVIVLYEGEKSKIKDEFWKNQRIVELPKKRPEWFSQNLLQPTTVEQSELESKKSNESDSKDVKKD